MSSPEEIEEGVISHESLVSLIRWIVAIATIVLMMSYVAYVSVFSADGLSNSQAVWGQFGDFIGGILNPILAFLSLIALVTTIVVQSNQLRISSKELTLSRKELELTRQELGKSAKAQELSEVALRAQAAAALESAQLATINSLLAHYKEEFRAINMLSYPTGDPRVEAIRSLGEKIRKLTELLNRKYAEVTADE